MFKIGDTVKIRGYGSFFGVIRKREAYLDYCRRVHDFCDKEDENKILLTLDLFSLKDLRRKKVHRKITSWEENVGEIELPRRGHHLTKIFT